MRMDEDTSMQSYTPESYFDALNIEIYTDETHKKRVVTSEKGTALIYTLPPQISIQSQNYKAYKLSKIIATHRIAKKYLIFVTATSSDGVNTVILYLTFENGVTLNVIYAGKLPFTNDTILKIKSRPLNNDKFAVYFTDGKTPLKHFVFPEDLTLKATEYFDIVPNVSFDSFYIKDVVAGGKLLCGKISYAFQLFDKNGKETKISALSNSAVLYNGIITNWAGAIKGSESSEQSNKSVLVEINGITTKFDYIRLYSIRYVDIASDPIINIVSEIEFNTSVKILDTGTSLGTISSSEFLELGGELISAEDIEINNNYLVAVNIQKHNSVDIDYDARVYRGFEKLGDFYGIIYKNDLTYTSFDLHSIPSIDKEHDCINPYNKSIILPTYHKCKYNKDGFLGGTGKNISYKFVVKPVVIGKGVKVSTGTGYTRTNELGSAPIYNPLTYSTEYNRGVNYPSDPVLSEKYRGYKRSEIYRFGIEFIDSKGFPYFVEWIGDIKFPHSSDKHYNNSIVAKLPINSSEFVDIYDFRPYHILDTGTEGSLYRTTYALNLGIEFTVSNIPKDQYGNYCSYRIVRVERTENNRTVVAQGLLTGVTHINSSTCTPPQTLASDGRLSNYPTGDNSNCLMQSLTNNWHTLFITPEDKINKVVIPVDTKISVSSISDCKVTANSSAVLSTLEILAADRVSVNREDALGNIKINQSRFVKASADMASVKSLTDLGSVGYANYVGVNGAPISLHGTVTVLGLSNVITYPNAGRFMVLIDLIKSSLGQYNGSSYLDRKSNIYIGCDNYVKGHPNSKTFTVFGGDTYISMFEFYRALTVSADYRKELNGGENTGQFDGTAIDLCQLIVFPVESSYNHQLRLANTHLVTLSEYARFVQETAGNYSGKVSSNYTQDFDLYSYNSGYLANNNIKKSFIKPATYLDTSNMPNQIRISDKSTITDITDAMLKFRSQNFRLAENEIFGITSFMDKVAFFEASAVGVFIVDEQVATSTDSGTSLIIGKGEKIGKEVYLTHTYGSEHKHSLIPLDESIIFVDLRNQSICILTPKGVVRLLGISTTINKHLLQSTYVHGIFDRKRDRVLFTLNNDNDDTSVTISYNITANAFVSKHSYKPFYYDYSINANVLSFKDLTLYEHNVGTYANYYSTQFESYIKLLLTPAFKETKVFSNIELNLTDGVPQAIEFEMSYYKTGQIKRLYNVVVFPAIKTSDTILFRNRFNKFNAMIPSFKASPNDKNARWFSNYLYEKIYLIHDTSKTYSNVPILESIANHFELVFG